MNFKVLFYLLFFVFILVMNWESQNYMAAASFHDEVSQEEAIRLRILANSDAIKDQVLKRDIRDEVNATITDWVLHIDSMEEAKDVIEANLDEIAAIVEKKLANNGINQSFSVEFNRVQFPTKLYGHLVYPAGEYEAVLITLGSGKGENWWCVLFPPLCFLDFSNGDAVEHEGEVDSTETEKEEVEVKFFVIELFDTVKSWFTA
ncbi:stage II sporulation protein R [Alkalihalobacterium alkalinitrilicum]|uniref:stage II sporulation protein R n=1 Tax=Alkalihalobacterium alkalinitrilicum TaxID=427920 RepID=UPI000995D9AD|nr:stage II sporulation protein R [Alkalihalobacterium alkalinitrilicum]